MGDEARIPLGMTIDNKGYLYLASYYGAEVLKIDPRLTLVYKNIYSSVFIMQQYSK